MAVSTGPEEIGVFTELEEFVGRELGAYQLFSQVTSGLHWVRTTTPLPFYTQTRTLYHPILLGEHPNKPVYRSTFSGISEAESNDWLMVRLEKIERITPYFADVALGLSVVKPNTFNSSGGDDVLLNRPRLELDSEGQPCQLSSVSDLFASPVELELDQREYFYWLQMAAGAMGVKSEVLAL